MLLTRDDSWAQEQVDAGLADAAARPAADPRAHAITRWLGADAPDEPPGVRPSSPPGAGRLVVCSDGLWNYAPTATTSPRSSRARASVDAAIAVARALREHALGEGGHDNITVAVVDVAPDRRTPPTRETEEPMTDLQRRDAPERVPAGRRQTASSAIVRITASGTGAAGPAAATRPRSSSSTCPAR